MDILRVPYRGAGQVLNELLARRISIALGNISTGRDLVRDGAPRALATTGAECYPALPGIPSFAQTPPGFLATVWCGLQVRRGTPAKIIGRLNREANTMLEVDAVRGRLANVGVAPMGGPPEQFSRFIAQETAQWRRVIRDVGITAERRHPRRLP